jgi:two-component system phosphate regulon sensor histidine kinase PhoR
MDKNTDIKKLQIENERLIKIYSDKADIVSVDAHQIRTSLSALKWIIKMFLDGDLGKLNTEQENLMRKAYEGNERAINIVSELLLINRNENIMEKKYVFEKIDLVEQINNSIFDFSGEAQSRGIEIIFLTTENKLPMIRADKEKFRVVLENLIENGIKYSDMHGKIFISLKQNDDIIEVSIKDTGIGISEEGQKRIFEKFYRDEEAKKRESTGSGIGLFTVKKIIEAHNGKIWFESKKNEGTTFFFTIPIFK